MKYKKETPVNPALQIETVFWVASIITEGLPNLTKIEKDHVSVLVYTEYDPRFVGSSPQQTKSYQPYPCNTCDPLGVIVQQTFIVGKRWVQK